MDELMGMAGDNLAWIAAAVIAGLWYWREKNRPDASTDRTGEDALKLAMQSHKEDFGPFAGIFMAMAKDDTAALKKEIEYLKRDIDKAGSISVLLDDYVNGLIKSKLSDPDKKSKLFQFLGAQLGGTITFTPLPRSA